MCQTPWCVVRTNFLELEMKLKSGFVWFDRNNRTEPSVEQQGRNQEDHWRCIAKVIDTKVFCLSWNDYRLVHMIAEYVIDSNLSVNTVVVDKLHVSSFVTFILIRLLVVLLRCDAEKLKDNYLRMANRKEASKHWQCRSPRLKLQ